MLTLVFSVSVASVAQAQTSVSVAVAANFLAAMKSLAKDFTRETGIPVRISNGSSGILYAQIRKGAPFDVFFSADAERPKLLEQQQRIADNNRFTYVIGRLVVWSPQGKISPDLSALDVANSDLRFMAIANPKTAPYGTAAKQVLQHYGLYEKLQASKKIAVGENVGKTFHYAATGNAQLGLVAKSYVANPTKPVKGKVFEVSPKLYSPIEQQAVILKGRDRPEVKRFIAFIQSGQARNKIAAYGYGLPG